MCAFVSGTHRKLRRERARRSTQTHRRRLNVLTEGDLSAWEQDWRKRSHGKSLAVVRPASTDEVSRVVKACVAAGVTIVPQGGNTGLVVGSTPDESARKSS